jgi:hypothetical protein
MLARALDAAAAAGRFDVVAQLARELAEPRKRVRAPAEGPLPACPRFWCSTVAKRSLSSSCWNWSWGFMRDARSTSPALSARRPCFGPLPMSCAPWP